MDEEKNFLKRLDELVSRSQKRYSTERTDFLPIRLKKMASPIYFVAALSKQNVSA